MDERNPCAPADISAHVGREFGNLEARVAALEVDIGTISLDVKTILSRTDRAFGIALLVWICIPTALGAALMWFIGKTQ